MLGQGAASKLQAVTYLLGDSQVSGGAGPVGTGCLHTDVLLPLAFIRTHSGFSRNTCVRWMVSFSQWR